MEAGGNISRVSLRHGRCEVGTRRSTTWYAGHRDASRSTTSNMVPNRTQRLPSSVASKPTSKPPQRAAWPVRRVQYFHNWSGRVTCDTLSLKETYHVRDGVPPPGMNSRGQARPGNVAFTRQPPRQARWHPVRPLVHRLPASYTPMPPSGLRSVRTIPHLLGAEETPQGSDLCWRHSSQAGACDDFVKMARKTYGDRYQPIQPF